MTLIRKLGRGEKLWWRFAQTTSGNAGAVARLSGKVDPSQLQQAVNKAAEAHPALQVCIEVIKGMPWFASCKTSSFSFEVSTRQGENDWAKIAEAAIVKPLPESNGPLFRIILLSGSSLSDMIFIFHHTIFDGLSVPLLLRDILEAYSGTNLKLHEQSRKSAPALHPPFEKKVFPQFLRANSFQKLTWFLRWSQVNAKRKMLMPIPDQNGFGSAELKTTFLPHILSPEETALLQKNCKAQKTTLHGALGAAMVLALAHDCQIQTPRWCLLGSALSVRHRMPASFRKTFGYFVSAGYSAHEVGPNSEFWELARNSKTQLDAFVHNGGFVFSTLLREFLLRQKKVPQEYVASMGELITSGVQITNVGQLAFSHDFPTIAVEDIFHLPTAHCFGRGFFGLAASGFKNHLRLTLFFASPVFSHEHGERFAEAFLNILKRNAVHLSALVE